MRSSAIGFGRCRAVFVAAVAGVLCRFPGPLGAAPGEWRAWEAARVRLHVARIRLVDRVYGNGFSDLSDARARECEALNDALRNLAEDRAPAPRPGVGLDAYISSIDHSAQPFIRYLPPGWTSAQRAPLMIYLHGYSPYYDRFNCPSFPSQLTNVAVRSGACIAVPFGRGNTDFQGIGEHDVFRVMDEMRARYGTDPRRVVLVGYSMGGMGAWCIAARHPQHFNAVMVLAGRGDFYVWHRLKPEDLPPWQRRLIDTQFASAWVRQLKSLPVLAVHARYDTLVSFDQGKAIFDQAARHNARARFIVDPAGDHWTTLDAATNAVGAAWLHAALSVTNVSGCVSRLGIGETGSRLQNAWQQPFVLDGGTDSVRDAEAKRRLKARADEWLRFAHGAPRTILEPHLNTALATNLNLFVFGEPESSPLIRRIFAGHGVSFTPEAFQIGARRFPRPGNGLWFTAASPFNTTRTAVVQCGIPWGLEIPDNHRYDRIPDVMVYTAQADFYGANLALGAGFVEGDGAIAWSDPASTPAILPPSISLFPPPEL